MKLYKIQFINHITRIICLILLSSCNNSEDNKVQARASESPTPKQIAFPGAEGFGKYSTGGRGGKVVKVTNLKDLDEDGNPVPGSFRAALNTEGEEPLTVIFNVSGNIALEKELKVKRSNLTIAGQTAPGDGITIKDHTIKLSGENLIIRYIRSRPGDLNKAETSALNIENAKNVIVDHCSLSWSVEENMGFYDNVNSTVQWCILSEGLYDSYDPKGKRSYGSQWGGQYSSYHHNLFAHNYSRSPRINGSRAHDTIALVDFRNNVIFNWGRSGAVYGGEQEIPGGENRTNFVNNYYKPGPATADELYFAAPSTVTAGDEAQGYGQWYFSGNHMEGVEGGMNKDNWRGVDIEEVGSVENIRSEQEFKVSPVVTHSAQEAFRMVLENAGATLPERDEVDERIVAEIRGNVEITGNGIINSQSEVGGWPKLESSSAPEDTDKDGIPDEWELKEGLDPENSKDGNEVAPGGYTNLEIYLNELVEKKP
ncbi:pectate lyase family protein [Autumnicola musiva]|uniref:Pectate lyase n=1 Tax=Autumnicola musiva TaxID=3075589 RepID=A0ABU3D7T1_9FLAO|nr:pectate lyase [Zunongwangia sp. F117]MDT0677594.1 pectate lyase [Zunongwangia sp. F117]